MMKGMQRESIVVLVIENSNNLLTFTCKEICSQDKFEGDD